MIYRTPVKPWKIHEHDILWRCQDTNGHILDLELTPTTLKATLANPADRSEKSKTLSLVKDETKVLRMLMVISSITFRTGASGVDDNVTEDLING